MHSRLRYNDALAANINQKLQGGSHRKTWCIPLSDGLTAIAAEKRAKGNLIERRTTHFTKILNIHWCPRLMGPGLTRLIPQDTGIAAAPMFKVSSILSFFIRHPRACGQGRAQPRDRFICHCTNDRDDYGRRGSRGLEASISNFGSGTSTISNPLFPFLSCS